MTGTRAWLLVFCVVACEPIVAQAPGAQKPPASLPMGGTKSVTRFFVTSRGIGRGGNLGGLDGADAHQR